MKIKLEESDIKTLKVVDGLWSYSIKTKHGDAHCTEIASKEDALIHAENYAKCILRYMLDKY